MSIEDYLKIDPKIQETIKFSMPAYVKPTRLPPMHTYNQEDEAPPGYVRGIRDGSIRPFAFAEAKVPLGGPEEKTIALGGKSKRRTKRRTYKKSRSYKNKCHGHVCCALCKKCHKHNYYCKLKCKLCYKNTKSKKSKRRRQTKRKRTTKRRPTRKRRRAGKSSRAR